MEIRNTTLYNLLVLCAVLIFASACSTKKQLINTDIKPIRTNKLLDSITGNQFQFNEFYGKFSAEFTNGGSKNSFKGRLKIKHDSIIWISLMPALGLEGLEVARVELTPDSVKFLDRFHSKYFVGTYDYIQKKFHMEVDYYLMQNFLTNQFFTYPTDQNIRKGKFRSQLNGSSYVLHTNKQKKVQKIIEKEKDKDVVYNEFTVDANEYAITKILILDIPNNRKLETTYSDFEDVDKQRFPSNTKMSFKNNDKKLNLDIEFSKIDIQKNNRYSFKIPSKYKPIDL